MLNGERRQPAVETTEQNTFSSALLTFTFYFQLFDEAGIYISDVNFHYWIFHGKSSFRKCGCFKVNGNITSTNNLTHLWTLFLFYTPWKLQKTFGFLIFPGGDKMRTLATNGSRKIFCWNFLSENAALMAMFCLTKKRFRLNDTKSSLVTVEYRKTAGATIPRNKSNSINIKENYMMTKLALKTVLIKVFSKCFLELNFSISVIS